jgi:Zn-dependent protease with chaperone function
MDFFERQTEARRHSKRLVVYFIIAVAMLIVSVYLAATLIFTGASVKTGHGIPGWWNSQLFFGVSLGTLAVVLIGSISKTAELSGGGGNVATMLGGQLIDSNTTEVAERRLLNIVDEMALASGLPAPPVYLLPDASINAFAAGHTPSDAVIGVTRGAMKRLNREELQGVIGHEFSHVLNGDMRLNVRLIGIIFGILCIATLGRILLQMRSRNSRERNPLPLFGLALLVIGGIGVVFGRLIQAAVSRQRECLADASAVQFTRNPLGLAGALKKIGALGSRIESPHASEANHLFFGDAVESWFATHPPLDARIRELDPSWDGTFPQISATSDEIEELEKSFVRARSALPPQLSAFQATSAAAVLPRIGQPTKKQLRYAEEMRASLPTSIKQAAREPLGAVAMIYSLLSTDEDVFRTQLQEISKRLSPEMHREMMRLLPGIREIATRAKLPLVDIALPALRRLSPSQFEEFSSTMQWLIESDSEINLFEYVLQKIVLRHLEPTFKPARKAVIQYYTFRPLLADCAVLLSTLARVGQSEATDIARAFRQGAQFLGGNEIQLNLVPTDQSDLAQVDSALNRLSQAVPQIKKNVLNACIETVACDGLLHESEAELLRAIADTLDCPMPPLVDEREFSA